MFQLLKMATRVQHCITFLSENHGRLRPWSNFDPESHSYHKKRNCVLGCKLEKQPWSLNAAVTGRLKNLVPFFITTREKIHTDCPSVFRVGESEAADPVLQQRKVSFDLRNQ